MNNEKLKAELAARGKVLTDSQRAKIAEQQRLESARIRAEFEASAPTIDTTKTALDRALERVPALVAVIQDIGDTVLTVSRSIIVSLLPVVLALALYVEAQRVQHGLMLFETSYDLAVLGAWFLVFANLLLELVIHWKNITAGYSPERKTKRSLRIFWRNARYFIGLDEQWTEKHHGPAHRYEIVLSVVTMAILALAIAGSMTDALRAQSGNWLEGFIAIFTVSTLLEMVTWGSGLLFALTVVKVSQALTSYVAGRSMEFAYELVKRATPELHPALQAHQAALEAAIEDSRAAIEREHLLAALAKAEGNNNRPFGHTATTPDGPEFGLMTESASGHGGKKTGQNGNGH
jgi:hypothetical protein